MFYTAHRSASGNLHNQFRTHDELLGLSWTCLRMVLNNEGRVSQKYIIQKYQGV